MKPDLYNFFESSFWTPRWCSFLVYMPFSWRNLFINRWYLVGVTGYFSKQQKETGYFCGMTLDGAFFAIYCNKKRLFQIPIINSLQNIKKENSYCSLPWWCCRTDAAIEWFNSKWCWKWHCQVLIIFQLWSKLERKRGRWHGLCITWNSPENFLF